MLSTSLKTAAVINCSTVFSKVARDSGAASILLNLSLDFVDGISSNEVEASISNMEARIKSCHSEVTRLFIEAQSWQGHQKDQNTLRVAQDKKDENDG